MNHLDEGTIHAWLDGALEAAQSRDIEAHIATCAPCSAAVAEARGLVAGASRILTALDDVPGGVVPASIPPTNRYAVVRRPRWYASRWVTGVAAALMLAIGVTTYNRRAVHQEMAAPNLTAAAVPRADSGVAGTTPAAAPTTGATSSASSQVANQSRPADESQSFAAKDAGRGARTSSASGARATRPTATEPTAGAALRKSAVAPAPAAPPSVRERATDVAAVQPQRNDAGGVGAASAAESRALAAAPVPAARPDTLPVRDYAGCYRTSAQLSEVVVTAAPSAASARTDAVDTKQRRRAAAEAPASAPSAGAAPADARVQLPPTNSSYVVLGSMGTVRLDTAREASAFVAAQPRTYRQVGRWTPLGRDSVRVVMNGEVLTFARSARVSCP